MCIQRIDRYVCEYEKRGETRRDEESRRATGEKRGESSKQANELARARSRHAAAVWRQGSPCSLKQSRRMPPTLAGRPIMPFSNLPASREPAFPSPSFLPAFLRGLSSSPHPAADAAATTAAACARRRTATV